MDGRKRWIGVIAAGCLVALGVSGMALAGGSSSSSTPATYGPWGRGLVAGHPGSAPRSAGGKSVSYYIVAITRQTAFVDADDSGSPTPGDYSVFTDDLYDQHTHQLIGHDHARCTINYAAEVCDGTFTIYGGDVAVLGTLAPPNALSLAVTGGTDSFYGKDGQATITGGGENSTKFTITIG